MKVHNLTQHKTLVLQVNLAKVVKEREEKKGQEIVIALNMRIQGYNKRILMERKATDKCLVMIMKVKAANKRINDPDWVYK